jgi:hypothetical protein
MRSKVIVLVLSVAVLVSCSPVRVRMYPGAPHFPATSPQSVDILRREPPRPHIAFAEIVYKPSPRVSRHEVDWVLRDRAARIGADALIIEVDNIYRESVWINPYRRLRSFPSYERAIVGVAIRYR